MAVTMAGHDESSWRRAVAEEEPLTIPQMKFQRRKLIEKGDLVQAEQLGEKIRELEIDAGEYRATEQEAWDVANGVPLSRSGRRGEAAERGPSGESLAQMEFDLKR